MNQLAKTYERSRVPLYLQVATALSRRIEVGEWKPGQQISTLAELEAEYQVARVTVRQAVEVLQDEGLVRCLQGKGTFVVEQTPQDVHFRFFNIYTADGRKVIPDSRETRIKTTKATRPKRTR